MVIKKEILIADDDLINISLLTKILSDNNNYSINAVQDGSMVFDFIKNKLPDLILLDIMMPKMDGYEVCKILKNNKLTQHIPVIFISGRSDVADEVKGFSLGAVDYIIKPIKVALVQARVALHLELKEHRENLQQLVDKRTKQLIHADRLVTLGTFSAGIAHEINNPNTYIQGNLQLLNEIWNLAQPIVSRHLDEDTTGKLVKFTDKTKDIIESTIHGSKRVTRIVDELKSYGKEDLDSSKELTFLTVPVEDAVKLIKHRINADVKINTDIYPEIEFVCDRQRISQMFVNLFNNAIDAFNDQIGSVWVKADQENEVITITVSDNGHGILDENVKRIFTPFFTTKGNIEGTGLGLWIVQGIVEDHGGNIIVDTNKNRGACFKITFPTKQEN